MKTVAIVQARLGSRRLPSKMLMDVGGAPALERTLRRVQRAQCIDECILATTTHPQDQKLLDLAKRLDIPAFAGDENDVLDRFYQAAKARNADVVVRLTGDCPLADPEVIDRVVNAYHEHSNTLDYASNICPPTFPDGLDVEVFPFRLLERIWREAKEKPDREHVTTFVRTRLGQFQTLNVAHEEDLSGLRWTLDEPEDLEFLSWIYTSMQGRDDFGWRDVHALQQSHPQRGPTNGQKVRNSGWMASVMQENLVPVRRIDKSNELWERASHLIPAGTQTLSKGPTQFVDGVAPKYIERGQGSHVWDVDGNEYIDYPMGLGPVTLGHCHPVIQEAICKQLEKGITFSMMNPLELEVAELLHELIPCAEQVRFGKNGSDATAAAVRCARAHTGRDLIAHCGYHGWQDWYIGSVGGVRARGVPEAVKALQKGFVYNDIASLERIFAESPKQVAAVIMEVATTQEPSDQFLQKVADLTRKSGAVLIFDEIISGFRYRLGGLQEYYGVVPDLAAVGKGMANGLPISAVVGKAEVMKEFEDIFFSFTFGGECLSLAAATACITFMRQHNVIDHFWRQGAKLQNAYREMVSRFELRGYTDCAGLPPWTICVFFDHQGQEALAMKSLFQQEMLKRGILFSGSQFLCHQHSDADIQETIDAYEASFKVLRHGVLNRCVEALLQGKKIQPVFRRV